jgi:hypothetical protein
VKQKFIQASCVEGKRVDLRQANVVARHKPDFIFFELPATKGGPASSFNNYAPIKKPFRAVRKIKDDLRKASRKYPYALSDVAVWENIEGLWREGHNILLFNVDAPAALRSHYHERYGDIPYSRARKHWWFWAYLLMRDRWMAENIREILKGQLGKREVVTIAVFLQSIHWEHVKFLLTKPSRKRIWKFYFGNFPELTPANVGERLREEDSTLYRYWQKETLGG